MSFSQYRPVKLSLGGLFQFYKLMVCSFSYQDGRLTDGIGCLVNKNDAISMICRLSDYLQRIEQNNITEKEIINYNCNVGILISNRNNDKRDGTYDRAKYENLLIDNKLSNKL